MVKEQTPKDWGLHSLCPSYSFSLCTARFLWGIHAKEHIWATILLHTGFWNMIFTCLMYTKYSSDFPSFKIRKSILCLRQHKISRHPVHFISLLVFSCFSALSITPANTIFCSNGSVRVCTLSMAISYTGLLNTWNMSTMTKELHFKLYFNPIYFTAT